MITLTHYLVLSAIIFSLGILGIIIRQNLIMVFFSTEILLNAANIAIAAIAHYYKDINGQVVVLFVIAIAAAEVAVGLGLLVLWYKKTGSIELESLKNL